MPVSYRIEPEEGIVYLTTDGTVPFVELEAVMLGVLSDPSYRPGFSFLSDSTRETDVPDTGYVRRCVDFLGRYTAEMGECRWAMVSRHPALFGMQRMFSTLAESYGITARVFREPEAARRWLLGQPD
jgi:hypothetical protein